MTRRATKEGAAGEMGGRADRKAGEKTTEERSEGTGILAPLKNHDSSETRGLEGAGISRSRPGGERAEAYFLRTTSCTKLFATSIFTPSAIRTTKRSSFLDVISP